MTVPPPAFPTVPTATIEVHPRNVRRAVGDVSEMADSMREHGVLEPLIVAPGPVNRLPDGARLGHCPDCQRLTRTNEAGILAEHTGPDSLPCPGGGGYAANLWRLIAGHRRLAAAKQAGLPEVPAVIRNDLDTEGKQLEVMLIENLHRSDLTPVEEAEAYEQLKLLGYKPARIAKATGRSRATVDRRLALLKLPEAAREKLQDHQVTLADAEALVEFAGDEQAIAKLEKSIGTSNFAFDLRRQQEDRQRAATERDERARLAKDGVTIVDGPLHYWDESPGAAVHYLVDAATGADLGPVSHAACPGRVAWIDERTGEAVEGCADYKANGHEERWAWRRAHPDTKIAAGAPAEDPEHAARRAALAQRDRDLKTAAGVRHEFLRGLMRPKRPADQTIALARLCAVWALMSESIETRLAAQLLNAPSAALDDLLALARQASPERCEQIVLACAIAQFDPGDHADAWGWNAEQTTDYMRLLADLGYQLSDVERAQLDELEHADDAEQQDGAA
jgi:ParB/RepB/Spo0J family partition protein